MKFCQFSMFEAHVTLIEFEIPMAAFANKWYFPFKDRVTWGILDMIEKYTFKFSRVSSPKRNSTSDFLTFTFINVCDVGIII